METLKCKMCGADLNPVDGQSTVHCSCGYVQETAAISNADIVNEIDSLLQMYKTALDGDVWSELDNVFPDVLCSDQLEEEEPDDCIAPSTADSPDESNDWIAPPLDNSPASMPERTSFLVMIWESIKMNKLLAIITAGVACAVVVFLIVLNSILIPNRNNNSEALMDVNNAVVDSTEDSEANLTTVLNSNYQNAVSLMDAGKYDEAITAFESLKGYKDSTNKIAQCHYSKATALKESGEILKALNSFRRL